jgi:hypothetical protein
VSESTAGGRYRYRMIWADGADAGERESSVPISPREILWIGGGRRLRVIDVLPADEHSEYAGLLKVERTR